MKITCEVYFTHDGQPTNVVFGIPQFTRVLDSTKPEHAHPIEVLRSSGALKVGGIFNGNRVIKIEN